MPGGDTEHQRRASHFMRGVERILRVICRLLVRRGIGVQIGVELMKRAYLEGAADAIKEQGYPVNLGRLQLMSGLARTEVERLRSEIASDIDLSEPKFAAITRLLTTWHLDHRYVQPFMGEPKELPITAANGESFNGLVSECAPQLNPKELLEELVRINAVSLDQETWARVRVMTRAYIPEPFTATDSETFGNSIANHLETLDVNSKKAGPGLGRFDRYVRADWAISPEHEAEFNTVVRQLGQETLEKLDSFLRQKEPAAENGRRVGTTIYYWVETGANVRTETRPVPPTPHVSAFVDTTANNAADLDNSNVIDTLTFAFTKDKE